MPFTYTDELAVQAYEKITSDEWRKADEVTRYVAEKPDSIGELKAALLGRPDLQAHIASRIGYTPSKWLLESELSELNTRRKMQGIDLVDPNGDAYARAAKSGLMGICFSGGGIRSATFNLGILQGLAELKLLHCFDYLSSVSGGGYIHQWFAAWSKRQGFSSVAQKLIALPEPGSPTSHPEPIRWLRRYANYLTPERGLFTADTWVLIAIWLRNTILNQIILGSGLLFLMFLPQLLTSPYLVLQHGLAVAVALGVIFYLFLIATFFCGKNLMRFDSHPTLEYGLFGQAGVQFGFVVPFVVVGLLITLLFPIISATRFGVNLVLCFSVSAALLMALALTIVFWGDTPFCYLRSHHSTSHFKSFADFWQQKPKCIAHVRMLFVLVGMVAAALLASLCGAAWIVVTELGVAKLWSHSGHHWWRLTLVIGPPLALMGLLITVIILLGLLGRAFDDGRREWLARLGAWMGMYIVAWTVLVGFSLFGYASVRWFRAHIKTMIGSVGIWIGTTVSGILAGKSSMTAGPKDDKAPSKFNPLEILAIIGPYVFITGLLILLSAIADVTVRAVLTHSWPFIIFALLLPLAICVLFALRVDINEFSMHAFYRNRLARCYLGASNAGRDPNPFSGFDDNDAEIAVSDLLPTKGYGGPFPIFCTTLNLTFGEDLAWQERKAASFAFTPLYSGYDVAWTAAKGAKANLRFNGFAKTSTYAYPEPGIHVSTAAAISGAAMSPNRGYHTNLATAFLMTVFNVRLGWWLRNPRVLDEDGRRLNVMNGLISPERESGLLTGLYPAASPRFSLLYLICELLGQSDDTRQFVYLTDGGHFDNMGLYELVRRRCRYIVVCDSEADADLQFEGIGMAIRKCRIDFGAEVALDLRPLLHIGDTKHSSAHCVVGTITYPEDPTIDPPGIVVYIKSSLTGDEPGDILNYKKENPAFPHDTTLNQWFTESQFESYRRLGHHVALSVFEPANASVIGCETQAKRGAYFGNLRSIWAGFTPQMKEHWANHTTLYSNLLNQVRTDPQLTGFFDMLFAPGDGKWKTKKPEKNEAQIEYAVAFSSELIEFMWIVYAQLSLVLPESRGHPFAQGWVAIFSNWAKIDVVRDGWRKYGVTYSLSFRIFAQQDLGLSALP